MDQGLTEHQKRCFEHLKHARSGDQSLAEYARAYGLQVRVLYDAAAQLRKKGVIAGAVKPVERPRARSEAVADQETSPFVSVRIEPEKAQREGFLPVLRMSHVRGHVLEFGSWPPAEVMAAILVGGRDVTA
jgi:hypothetical protein